MTVVNRAGQWHIEGLGRERARLAFACLTGDQIMYTFDPPSTEKPLVAPATVTS
jgi:hypothetical protein